SWRCTRHSRGLFGFPAIRCATLWLISASSLLRSPAFPQSVRNRSRLERTLEGELQPGKRTFLGQVQPNLLGLGIDIESRSQKVAATSRDVLRQLESRTALGRDEIPVSKEVHALHVAGDEESLGRIKTDFRPGGGERYPYLRGGKRRRLRHAIVHLGGGTEGSGDVKYVELKLQAQIPLFAAENIVLVAGNQEPGVETASGHRVHVKGLTAKRDRAVEPERLGLVEVGGGEEQMVLPGELPVHLSVERGIRIKTHVLLQIEKSATVLAGEAT